MIPKIIHHIAPEDISSWHPFWHKCRNSWENSFSDYEFILWNDQEDINKLVYDNYRTYWNLYQSFPVHIMRIDFARLCILHKFGGIYADMDYYCYNNFEKYLKNHSIYLVENLTEEFTSAIVENSLMAAEANNKFFLDTMGYVQACYIQFRNHFNKMSGDNWKTSINGFYINNTTGSGMLHVARESYGRRFYDIGHFNTAEFNNRPSSFSKSFKTKHIHTSIWGEDQLRNDNTREILIVDGNAITMDKIPDYAIERLKDSNIPHYMLNFDTYDFHKDYTGGKYLKRKNLEQVKQWIKSSEEKTAKIMKYDNT
jgi:hypothetical protein